MQHPELFQYFSYSELNVFVIMLLHPYYCTSEWKQSRYSLISLSYNNKSYMVFVVFSWECIPGFINLFNLHIQFLRAEKISSFLFVKLFPLHKRSNPLSLKVVGMTSGFFSQLIRLKMYSLKLVCVFQRYP